MALKILDKASSLGAVDANKTSVVFFVDGESAHSAGIARLIEETAETFSPTAEVCTLDIGRYPEQAGELGVQRAPAVKIFREGKVLGGAVGFIGRGDLADLIRKNI